MQAHAAITQRLEDLLGDVDFLHISKLVDSDTDEVTFSAGVRQDGRTRYVERDSLGELLDALGGEQQKPCSRCGQVKPLSQFPRKPEVGDGRASHCRVCDRERMATRYTRAQRGRLVRPAS